MGMRHLLQFSLDLWSAGSPNQPSVQPEPQPSGFDHPRANRFIQVGGVRVGYAFARGKRRTIGMVIGPDGLVVRAPKWTPLYEVEAALHDKSDWIVRKLCETKQRHQLLSAETTQWQQGGVVCFMGQALKLHLDPTLSSPLNPASKGDGGLQLRVDEPKAQLAVGLPDHASREQIRDAVQAWLMRKAQALFAQRLEHYAPLLRVQWTKLSLSSAQTRWGSASHDGTIRLNWRLIHYPLRVIDYVVAHELSHLRHMNHSPQFWETVASVVPDFKARRKDLKLAKPIL
jgi:predicted metal-dependent hydrolase